MKTIDKKTLMTSREAAKLLGLSYYTLAVSRSSKYGKTLKVSKLKPVRSGRSVFYRKKDVQRFKLNYY